MPTLLPFRDIDEKDVINIYSYSGSIPVNKGTLVKIVGSGWVHGQEPTEMLGSPGASYANTVSQRYGNPFKVANAGTGDNALGVTLMDVKETDPNGTQYKFDRNLADEHEVIISGQTVPVARKGMFLYSGITGATTAGQKLYVGAAGTIESVLASAQGPQGATGIGPAAVQVGIALGEKDPTNGFCLVQLDIS
jgi:hypothetical protein